MPSLIIAWFSIHSTSLINYLYQCRRKQPQNQPTTTPIHSNNYNNNNSNYTNFALTKIVYITIELLLVLVRGLYTCYYIDSGGSYLDDNSLVFYFNPVMIIVMRHFRIINSTTLKALSLISITAVHIEYAVNFQIDDYLLQIAYQVMLGDNMADLIVQLNSKIKRQERANQLMAPKANWQKKPINKPIQWLNDSIALYRQLWHSGDQLHLKLACIDAFPNLSKVLRIKLIVYSTITGKIIALILTFLAFIQITIALGMGLFMLDKLPATTLYLIACIDATIMVYNVWAAFRSALFLLHFALILAFVSSKHMCELNVALNKVINSNSNTNLLLLKRQLFNYFYTEHANLQYVAEYTNQRVVSNLFGEYFLMTIAANIILLSHLLFERLYLSESLVIGAFLVVQTGGTIQAMASLIRWSGCLYCSDRLLFKAQLKLGGGAAGSESKYRSTLLISTKIKLMAFYERLCTRSKFRFEVGCFGHLSKRTVYEFFFAYSGMVMYVSKIIYKNQMKASGN